MDKSKLPRHKLEELRRKEDEARTKELYKEFIEEFDDSKQKLGKTFIRAGVVNAESGDKSGSSKPVLYRPLPAVVKQENPLEMARKSAEEKAKKVMEEAAAKIRPQKPGKKKDEKPKSNLEAFKEELRRVQEEREERRKLRKQLQEQLGMESEPLDKIAPSLDNPYLGTYDTDPMTTNLFMSNLNPKSTEEEVCRTFGRFGPLASVKIMWPRTDDERTRGYLTGFVAFMTRKDADRAASTLKGREVLGYEMKLNWGKPVPIPQHPVYVPPRMLEMTLPPPPSGLPFNAQPLKEDVEAFKSKWPLPAPGTQQITEDEKREAWEKMIKNAVVKVVIPTERPLLCLVHRVIEFVVREGPMFEAMIMSKEVNNPIYRFLFDNQSPAHVYYRWKLFSILQGDSATKWRTDEFRMFENGSTWRPPPVNFYQQGMPAELYDEVEKLDLDQDVALPSSPRSRRRSESPKSEGSKFAAPIPPSPPHGNSSCSSNERHAKRSALSDSQRRKLKTMLNDLTPEREKISDAMVYCVEHAEGAEEIVAMIEDGIADSAASLTKKIAKLYLTADILANCAAKVFNVSYYRKFFGSRLESIFQHLHSAYSRIDARLKAEQFKQRVLTCCRVWEDTAVYTTDFLIKLQNIFLGLATGITEETRSRDHFSKGPFQEEDVEDIEGVPMDDDNEQQGSSGIGTVTGSVGKPLVDYDLDGVPLEEESDDSAVSGNDHGQAKVAGRNSREMEKPAFVRSRWETVEPDVVESQAITLSKWEQLEREEKAADNVQAVAMTTEDPYEEDLDGVPLEDDAPGTVFPSTRAQSSSASASMKNEMAEGKRLQLREIEVKVMKYQDELESGQRSRPHGVSVNEEVEKYRQRLLKKIEERPPAPPSNGSVSQSSSHSSWERNDKRSTSQPEKTSKQSSSSAHVTSSKTREGSERKEKTSSSSRKKHRSRSRSRSRSPGYRRSKHTRKSRSRSRSPGGRHKKRKY